MFGSYENVRVLKMLVDAGAPLQLADKNGKTCLHLALANGLTTLAKAIQKLIGKQPKTWVTNLSDVFFYVNCLYVSNLVAKFLV